MTEPVRLGRQEARNLLLHAQGLTAPAPAPAGPADVLECIRQMGVLQIDTIHVVARSPYLVLWSRLGDYDQRWLDEHLADGTIFEAWSHEASFLPTERFLLHRGRDDARAGRIRMRQWLAEHRPDADRMLALIEERGPVKASDFAAPEGHQGGWWAWKPDKILLEALFASGELLVARRERFQRVYDLAERVQPDLVGQPVPDPAEAERGFMELGTRALGVATANWAADHFRQPRNRAPRVMEELERRGIVVPAEIEGVKGRAWVHRDMADFAREVAGGGLASSVTTILSPFDPIVWDRARGRELFDFTYLIECYTPEPKRVYGYFSLPILHRGALVGRLDAKAHRKEGRFEVRALHLEPGVPVDSVLAEGLARALRDAARWHGAPEVTIAGSNPPAFGKKVTAALRKA